MRYVDPTEVLDLVVWATGVTIRPRDLPPGLATEELWESLRRRAEQAAR